MMRWDDEGAGDARSRVTLRCTDVHDTYQQRHACAMTMRYSSGDPTPPRFSTQVRGTVRSVPCF